MLDDRGYEVPDNTPVAIPARLRLPTSRAEQIRAYIRHELSMQAEADGRESFDEANDLDVEEMADFPMTEYERSGQFGYDDLLVEPPPSLQTKAAPPSNDEPSIVPKPVEGDGK